MEVEVAEFLLNNKEEIVDDLRSKKFDFCLDYLRDEYNSAMTLEIREFLSNHFVDYMKLTEIVSEDFIIKVYGKEFFSYV